MSESLVLEGSLRIRRRGRAGGQERPADRRSPELSPASARVPRMSASSGRETSLGCGTLMATRRCNWSSWAR
jgi:hypothetical protein